MAESLATASARVGVEVPRQQSPLNPRALVSPLSPWTPALKHPSRKGCKRPAWAEGVVPLTVHQDHLLASLSALLSLLRTPLAKLAAGPVTCFMGHIPEPLLGPDSFQWCPSTGQGATGTN